MKILVKGLEVVGCDLMKGHICLDGGNLYLACPTEKCQGHLVGVRRCMGNELVSWSPQLSIGLLIMCVSPRFCPICCSVDYASLYVWHLDLTNERATVICQRVQNCRFKCGAWAFVYCSDLSNFISYLYVN